MPSGTKYMAVTNTKGAFTITGMRPGGPYNVKVSYIGYRTKDFTDLKLSLGETYDLPVWLEADTKELGEVVVTGQPGVNNTRNGAAESIGNARIEELPSLTHSVADVACINPFVKVTEGGAMYFAGSNNRYNSIMIDGAMSNDVFGLTANGANGGWYAGLLYGDHRPAAGFHRALRRTPVWLHRWCCQRHHQVGYQRLPRKRLLLLPEW